MALHITRLMLLTLWLGLSGCGESPSSPPQPAIYHLETQLYEYAINVEIDSRGTFRWGGGGCDVSFLGDGGQWQAIDDRLVLTPIGDNGTFVWLVTPAGQAILIDDEFERLEITTGPREGEVIASGVGAIRGDSSASWLVGGTCATGCNNPTVPCDDPYLGTCYSSTQPAYCDPDS